MRGERQNKKRVITSDIVDVLLTGATLLHKHLVGEVCSFILVGDVSSTMLRLELP